MISQVTLNKPLPVSSSLQALAPPALLIPSRRLLARGQAKAGEQPTAKGHGCSRRLIRGLQYGGITIRKAWCVGVRLAQELAQHLVKRGRVWAVLGA